MIFKNLTFDGISLKEYGVYISGEAVFDSPTREVEMITIPGRNGSFALDKGRFNNITVTYPAGIYATSETEFAEKVSTLRNLLASRKGYCRLTDEYNPDEFRLGVYKAGLELDPTHYNEAGRFELSFDCKPQRFLFSGEEVFTLDEWGQTETKSGSIVSFEGDETTAIKSLTAQIVPKQSGSGDPSPSNVRPISGWDAVNVTRCGKNLVDPSEIVNGKYMAVSGAELSNADRSHSGLIKVKPNTSYFMNGYAGGSFFAILALDENMNVLANYYGGASKNNVFVATMPSNARYVYLNFFTSQKDTMAFYEATTNEGYIAYNGETYSISFGSAGTVYGGTLEVMSGKLTITHGYADMGSFAWDRATIGNTYVFRTSSLRGIAKNGGSGISSRYKLASVFNEIHNNGYFLINNGYWSADYPRTIVHDDAYTDATAFKTAMNGVQLVYELATPTEIQLTPTEVKSLLGANNIWADSGDVTVEIGQNPYILVNPTLFEACPLIEFNSSGEDGEINLGSRQIKVLSAILGRINLGLDVSGSRTTTRTWQDVITVQNAGSFNAGDTLRFNGGKVIFTFNFTPINVEVVSQGTDLKASWQRGSNNLELSLNNLEFPAGTDTTDQFTCDIKVKASLTPSIEGTETFTVTTSYNRNGVLTITWAGGNYSFGEYTYIQGASNYAGYGDSTKNSLEDVDIYVDLDIGEAYSVDSSDNVVSLNNFVNLGGELPTLEPGATEITTDSSISNVKVTPRWWKV